MASTLGRRGWERRGHALLGQRAGSRARGPRRDGGAYSFPHADPGAGSLRSTALDATSTIGQFGMSDFCGALATGG